MGGSLLELCKTTESSPCLNSLIFTPQAISRIFVHKNLATFFYIYYAQLFNSSTVHSNPDEYIFLIPDFFENGFHFL